MQLERYGHGGDLRTAEEAYGIPADRWLDFSSNMNPWGPPEAVGELMRERWREIAHYPDPGVRKLRAKLSDVYGVPVESILVGNGAAELIELVVRLLNPANTLLAQPSFSEYEEAALKAGSSVRGVPLDARDDFCVPDFKRTAEQAAALHQAIFLGHPNNPTGRLIPDEVLRPLAASGAQLILDEAFMDFVRDEAERSLIRTASKSERVVVIRSMTKFYAVPGIRLGFLVAHPDLVRKLAALQTQWSVNYLAQLIGEAVLDDRAYAARTHDWLAEERPWLVERLRSLGLRVVPSDVNFLLAALPPACSMNAKQLQHALARRGIMIRDASLFKGLDDCYFRIAIRLRHENERLVQQLEAVLG